MHYNMKLGIVIATYLEAQPFIRGLGLKRLEKRPFRIYSGGDICIALSGVGKVNAALATSHLIREYGAEVIVNAGAAGATGKGMDVGDIFHVDRVLESDRPRFLIGGRRFLKPDLLQGFRTACVSTQDRPVLRRAEREELSEHAELVDMEAASVVHTCRKYGVRCYIFKIVSDTPDQHRAGTIILNMKLVRKPLYEFFRNDLLSLLRKG